jgi:hypothetical protein
MLTRWRRSLRPLKARGITLALVLIAATGLRRGEALGLAWENGDLDAGTVKVAATIGRVGGRLVITEPKSARSRRAVPLHYGSGTAAAGVGGAVALVVANRRQNDLAHGRFVERFGAAATTLAASRSENLCGSCRYRSSAVAARRAGSAGSSCPRTDRSRP